MQTNSLIEKALAYLQVFCQDIPTRQVGSQGNRQATDFFARSIAPFGFQIECPQFTCLDWKTAGASLLVKDQSFEVFASPYSLGCQVQAPLVVASSLEELESLSATGRVLLVRGELTKEQLMPLNFPFYQPEEHQHLLKLFQDMQPLAILAATSQNPELAGAVYPFPLIEDGDFPIPSGYMTEEEGTRLATHAGQEIQLNLLAERIPSTGCNVVARKSSDLQQRVVVCAHIDSKIGTPGALDNAAGVVTLLLLGELLQDVTPHLGIEIVALNGEDYYGANGQLSYLAANRGRLGDIRLAINMDALGERHGDTCFSFYDCSPEIADLARSVFASHPGIVEGETWYQSDHMVFAQNGVPALAITSQHFMQIETEIAHTAKDVPELVDPARLVQTALALKELILAFDQRASQ